MTRLEHILDFIEPGDNVADIGCEGAILNILLAKKGISSIGSDIKIDTAKRNIKEFRYSSLIQLKEGDGLSTIDDSDGVNTLIFSGMGTHLIISILQESKSKYNKIITISNNKHSILRQFMNDFGYSIFKEQIFICNSKTYNLIVFILGKEKLSKEEIYFGKNHVDEVMFNKKYEIELKRLYNLAKKVPINKQKEIKIQMKMISKRIY